MYTSQKFGEDLELILNQSYDVIKIARWAEHVYTIHCRELSPELDDIIMALSAMEHGPEFEYTEQELKLLAELLINEVEDPIKQINDLKSKELD
jgi:hypothetical protein